MTMKQRRASSIDRHVSQKMRERRRALDLSQGDVAKRLGISFQQVQKYEKSENRISAGRLFQLAHIFEVGITYFFDGLSVTRRSASSEPKRRALRVSDRRTIAQGGLERTGILAERAAQNRTNRSKLGAKSLF